jgi:TonB family protein
MSESSVPTQSFPPDLAIPRGTSNGYRLSDDLARLCLPREFSDPYRTLAWVNSICALFLLIGIIGLKAPKVVQKPLSEPVEVVPVIFTPPEEPPKTEPEVKPDEQEPPQETTAETPQVVTVVAAADASSVAFAVPVQGAVAIASAAHLATPPPPVTQAPPKPTQFNAASAGGGVFPDPDYPSAALRNRYQGTVIIEFTIDTQGQVTSAKVQKTSGFSVLDEAALAVVRDRWRFAPGAARWLYKPFQFKLQ